MIGNFLNKKPKFLGDNYFVAETAAIIGDVTLGNNVSVWFNAVIRGDDNIIVIGEDCNIQDCCVLHVHPEYKLILGNSVTVGHQALLHGCTVEDECLIGMQAVVLDGAVIGKNCIIGAGSLVTQNKIIPPNSLVFGSPAKIIRQVTVEEIEMIKWSARHYIGRIADYRKT